MWTSLSAGRWTCLLTLAVVMFLLPSQGQPMLSLPCCTGGQIRKVQGIQGCFEQESRNDCPHHYYVLQTSSSSVGVCVKPEAQWLKNQVDAGALTCDSVLPLKRRYEVLDKYDMEW